MLDGSEEKGFSLLQLSDSRPKEVGVFTWRWWNDGLYIAIRELWDVGEDIKSPFEKITDEMRPSGKSQLAVRMKMWREHSVTWFRIEMSCD